MPERYNFLSGSNSNWDIAVIDARVLVHDVIATSNSLGPLASKIRRSLCWSLIKAKAPQRCERRTFEAGASCRRSRSSRKRSSSRVFSLEAWTRPRYFLESGEGVEANWKGSRYTALWTPSKICSALNLGGSDGKDNLEASTSFAAIWEV